ncbi:hypothetical protein TYRP_021028 [Tyrophagus putrescentiae]|nr:hypothetical protein TYRP_021028 [Tyrophagus putrescentiae]
MCSKQPTGNCCNTKSSPSTTTSTTDDDQIRQSVREHYGGIVSEEKKQTFCCNKSASGGSCFGANTSESYAAVLGYSPEELAAVPDGANLGLGCGNPLAFTSIKPGDTVLDLGSGAGFDAFIAARKVGPNGRVIGVDMTPEMVSKAREKAVKGGFGNVSFRLGEIEHLPVADGTVDLVISNCVLNLSPQKRAVLEEVFRVLKPGGQVVISDIVTTTGELPKEVRSSLAMYAGCISGASVVSELEGYFEEIGFVEVTISKKEGSDQLIESWKPEAQLQRFVYSAIISAKKSF